MLKQVGASGQISLGKRFAKQLFEVVFHADGRVELMPVRVVRQAPSAMAAAPVDAPDGWLPPGGYGHCNPWARDNREALQAYAAGIDANGTAAEQMQRFLEQAAPAD